MPQNRFFEGLDMERFSIPLYRMRGYEPLAKSGSEVKQKKRVSNDKRCWVIVIGLIVTVCFLLGVTFAGGWSDGYSGKTFDQILSLEAALAKKKILDNIGPRIGALDGLVVASPSKGDKPYLPNYYFTWTRDSALVHSSLLSSFLPHAYLTSYAWSGPRKVDRTRHSNFKMNEDLIRAYIHSQDRIQSTTNPSGGFMDGGLNEPKFQVDGSPFRGDWGRPQRDGPALRALRLIPYAHFLLDRSYSLDVKYVQENLYDPQQVKVPGRIIKNDLEEVASGWMKHGFDLWEEVDGYHFFTLIVSMRALQAGAILASRLNDTGAETYYVQQAGSIGEKLEDFWDDEKGYYLSSLPKLPSKNSESSISLDIPNFPSREWQDCSMPLSLIHAGNQFDSANVQRYPNITFPVFGPTNPRVLATLDKYIKSFEGMYKINGGKNWTQGWALGRYKEDVYDGVGKSIASPWHICTNAIAQSFYLVQSQLYVEGSMDGFKVDFGFWSDIMKESVNFNDTERRTGDVNFDEAIVRLGEIGDGFLNVSRRAFEEGGKSMSEQIDRNNGNPRGARDLTWSYSSFVTAVRAREEAKALLGL
ncbi:uncharacterized protein IL334_006590 [Kwoniella shivajii]|uniref:glucan 1,4-alpha-glucosidase n=1 Tax=Kwoniella shivajii TaxID=564305 RepID=A0ABZ1D6Z8_9TREE|nr:hypothetical protein IL334_006590 [Kwoniella shivajii]